MPIDKIHFEKFLSIEDVRKESGLDGRLPEMWEDDKLFEVGNYYLMRNKDGSAFGYRLGSIHYS